MCLIDRHSCGYFEFYFSGYSARVFDLVAGVKQMLCFLVTVKSNYCFGSLLAEL